MSIEKLNCAIVSPTSDLVSVYAQELTKSSAAGAIDGFRDYPDDEVLNRMLRLNAVDLLIIDCVEFERALEIIRRVREGNAAVEVIAICEEDVKVLASLLRSGIRDYIPSGAPIDTVRTTLANCIEKLRGKPQQPKTGGDIVAFLPGKPGSGASTIAGNTALLAAKAPSKRVLLVDLDREAPMQAFLNRLHPEHFLQEALGKVPQMDTDIWSRLISQRGPMDLLPSEADGATMESGRVRQLLDFVRRAYDLTCVDMPGTLDQASVEVLLEAKRVYLTCTQELASVHITIRKAERLRRLGLGKEMKLLVNRYDSGHVMTQERIADLIGLPVELALPNSYALANASAERGGHVDPNTALGKSYAKLAQLLLNERLEIPRTQRKFIEYLYSPFLKQNETPA